MNTLEWNVETLILDLISENTALSLLPKSRHSDFTNEIELPAITVSAEREGVLAASTLERMNVVNIKVNVALITLAGIANADQSDVWHRHIYESIRKPKMSAITNVSAFSFFSIFSEMSDSRELRDGQHYNVVSFNVAAALR